MKLVFLFLAASVLFTAAATPMMISFGSPSPPSAPGPLSSSAPESPGLKQALKVSFGYRPMTIKDRAVAKDLMIDHYKGLQPGNDQKQARLAFAQNGWIDGMEHDDQHRQYLNFNYHRGEHPNSAKIGQTVTVARDRPPPQPHFSNEVLSDSKPDLTKEMNEKYKALPPNMAKHVRSMKAQNDWADGPGLREEAQITFHHGNIPLVHNTIGKPVTVYRPMSFLMDGKVPKDEIPTIKRRIREEHEKLDENHPLKQANYGVVTHGWQKVPGSIDRRVTPTMYKVKDKLPDNAEEGFEKISDFPVPLGMHRKPKAQGISRAARKRLRASTRP